VNYTEKYSAEALSISRTSSAWKTAHPPSWYYGSHQSMPNE